MSKVWPVFPKFPVKVLQTPADMWLTSNISIGLPDTTKIIVADIHLLWGEVETALTAVLGLTKKTILGVAASPPVRTEKKYLLRQLLKINKEVAPEAQEFWTSFLVNRKFIQDVRNALAHYYVVGMFAHPANYIAINGILKDGRTTRLGLPVSGLDFVRRSLKWEQEIIRFYYESFINKLPEIGFTRDHSIDTGPTKPTFVDRF